jgi:DNA-binding NarL/FixJ family response regulator
LNTATLNAVAVNAVTVNVSTSTRALSVRIGARDAAMRARVAELAHACGFPVPGPDGSASEQGADTVLVAAAHSLDEALAQCQGPQTEPGAGRLLIAEDFSLPSALRAVRSGAVTMLRLTAATPAQFAAAVEAAHRGEGMMPYEVLVRVLGGVAGPPPGPAPIRSAALTERQRAVLSLVADGYGNAAIAQTLSCSEHTVKNVIYDLTARLQVHNRAHAVARAVRTGLI